MTARTGREQALHAWIATLDPSQQQILAHHLAVTALAQMESARNFMTASGLVEGEAPASEAAPAAQEPPATKPFPLLAPVPDHTAAQDAADFGRPEPGEGWPPVTYLSCGDVLPADLVIGSTAECPRHGRKVTVLSPVDYACGLGEGPAGAGFPGPAACGHCGETVPHSHRDDPEPGEAWPMGHLASLAGRLAERATPGAGGSL